MKREEEMYQALNETVERDAPKIRDGLSHLASNIFRNEMKPQDALGVGEKKAEQLYAQAYQLYNMGKFKQARSLFGALLLLDPFDVRYLFGQAASSHLLKEYETAAELYMKCGLFEEENPVPYFHASDCYLQMKEERSAIAALNLAIKRAGESEQYAVLKERAEQTLKTLQTSEGKERKAS